MTDAQGAFTARYRAAVDADGRSLSAIAAAAGVNRKTAQRLYSEGREPMLSTAFRLEQALGARLVLPAEQLLAEEVAAVRKILAAVADSGEAA